MTPELYEEIVETIEAIPGAFRLHEVPVVEDRIRDTLQVVDDLVLAGLLRTLDTREGDWYCRVDVSCAIREPEMRVYRCYDAGGVLLYIGCTSRPVAARVGNHVIDKAWWPTVASITEEIVLGYRRGFATERAAILAERPLHNVAHNRRRLAEAGSAALGPLLVVLMLALFLLAGVTGFGAA